jgi:hypothetical protein
MGTKVRGANLRRAVTRLGRIYLADFVVPGPARPHFTKLFDIHMMLGHTGRKRTEAEYARLFAATARRYTATH